MDLHDELQIRKPLDIGQETILSVMLTREHLAKLMDERLFKSEGITDQQYNVLRILIGGPPGGYLIREIRERMITRNADVPRLVDRLAAGGLVLRGEDPEDRRGCRVRITPAGRALRAKLEGPRAGLADQLAAILAPEDNRTLLDLLERLRDGIRGLQSGDAAE
ncbi:MAG TPA: MarR family transcriptional regulator [Holophaga sp.]|nr:MarR family transcriptional regulator [Holophaga sp.]